MSNPRRSSHYLRRNETTRAPARVVFLDTEANVNQIGGPDSGTEHTLRLWVASLWRNRNGRWIKEDERRGTTGHDFCLCLVRWGSARNCTWLFAHNLPYDATLCGLWEECVGGLFQLGKYVIEDPPTMLRLTSAGRSFRAVDTLNYWRMPLETLGESIGTPKLPMPPFDATDDEWYRYCAGDVAVIESAVVALLQRQLEDDLGCFAPTAPGCAWNAYRHRWMDVPILIHANQQATELERDAYYGGQVWIGRVGSVAGPVYHVDANSLYPAVMRQNLFPCRLIRQLGEVPVTYLERMVEHYAVIARVRVLSSNQEYPCRMGCNVRWARGGYCTTIATPEIIRAIEHRDIVQVFGVSVYEHANLFGQWVDDWHGRRCSAIQDGNVAAGNVSKLYLNALPGKFGQKAYRWSDTDCIASRDHFKRWVQNWPADNRPVRCRSVAGKVQAQIEEGESYHSFPAIAAHVTAYGREWMRGLRQLAGVRNCYYQDTDSLHLNEQGFQALAARGLIHPTRLGALKLCDPDAIKRRIAERGGVYAANHKPGVFSSAHYHGWKRYELDGLIVAAGLKPSAVQVADGTWLQDYWQGAEQLTRKEAANSVHVRPQKIKLRDLNIGGNVNRDGTVDFPFLT